jgi:uncharacterized membrane protein YdjX (TVP38/TMEM64 family)
MTQPTTPTLPPTATALPADGPFDLPGVRAGRRGRLGRLLLLLAVAAAVVAAARLTGLTKQFSLEAIRARVELAGVWGPLLFLAIFAARDFLQVPALVLAGAGVVAFGPWYGGLLCYVGGNLAVCICFLATRFVGGRQLDGSEHWRIARLLRRLDRRPVWTVFVLRNIFVTASPFSMVLALTNVRFRDYAVGSALGLVLPCVAGVGVWVLILEGVLRWL